MGQHIEHFGAYSFLSKLYVSACKRKEEQQVQPNQIQAPKKPRLVFTDIQRRTLQVFFGLLH